MFFVEQYGFKQQKTTTALMSNIRDSLENKLQ